MYLISKDRQAIDTAPVLNQKPVPPIAECYGTMVGAVHYGGVIATPIRIYNEEMFDARAWIFEDRMVSVGVVWHIVEEGLPQ